MSEPRWCSRHSRLECARPAHGGRTCHGSAVRGTDRCRMHLGQPVEAVRRAQLTAWAAAPDDYGITPRAAVAGQLGLAWRRAELLGAELHKQAGAANGDSTADGLVGHTYSASAAAGGIYPTGERTRALVELEAAERERVVRFAEAAHRMGVEDRLTELAQHQGMQAVILLRNVVEDLGHDPRDESVRAIVARRLHQLPGSVDDG